ncbi:MAG: deoxyribodipyrimidine photo-lyase [bacterium]
MNPKRIRLLQEGTTRKGPVVYWMQRDQRVNDNWALIYSQNLAIKNNVPLLIVFNLVPDFLEATVRQYGFMIAGLKEVESKLKELNIPFFLTQGNSGETIPAFINEANASILVSDFNPLKIVRLWKRYVAKNINIPFFEVDAHNIVPCLIASQKVEFGAYTIRPKINKLLPEFLDSFTDVVRMNNYGFNNSPINWEVIKESLKINFNVKEVDWLTPGADAADKVMKIFFEEKLQYYSDKSNDPNEDAVSNLSPYLHFGHIAAQRIALESQPFINHPESQKAFLEELIVRRELSDNFCYYNKSYDSFEGFPNWAKATLNLHRNDKREFLYSLEEFEHAKTHDDLWNASQLEMVNTGKMHGYMRMYWAKKNLEWSESPEGSLRITIYLNDKYELDGRDPNGYTGAAWSIGGVHDRAWTERPVFGKIRYMNYNGCKRKFDVEKYIGRNQF